MKNASFANMGKIFLRKIRHVVHLCLNALVLIMLVMNCRKIILLTIVLHAGMIILSTN